MTLHPMLILATVAACFAIVVDDDSIGILLVFYLIHPWSDSTYKRVGWGRGAHCSLLLFNSTNFATERSCAVLPALLSAFVLV